MSGCAIRRWGVGTSCPRPADTPAAREMNASLKAMQAERARQDAMLWGQEETDTQQKKESNPPVKANVSNM